MSRYEEFSFALLMRVQMLPRSALSQGYEGLVAKSQAGGKSARQVLVIMTWSCIAVYAEMLLKGCNPSPSDREKMDAIDYATAQVLEMDAKLDQDDTFNILGNMLNIPECKQIMDTAKPLALRYIQDNKVIAQLLQVFRQRICNGESLVPEDPLEDIRRIGIS
jgi:hypothetical protein